MLQAAACGGVDAPCDPGDLEADGLQLWADGEIADGSLELSGETVTFRVESDAENGTTVEGIEIGDVLSFGAPMLREGVMTDDDGLEVGAFDRRARESYVRFEVVSPAAARGWFRLDDLHDYYGSAGSLRGCFDVAPTE